MDASIACTFITTSSQAAVLSVLGHWHCLNQEAADKVLNGDAERLKNCRLPA